MITWMYDCTPEEIGDHIAYLGSQDGWGECLANVLRGARALRRADIESVCYLGSMLTAFSELGSEGGSPFKSAVLYGRPKFRVCEVLPTLQRVQPLEGNSRRTLERIEFFKAEDAQGELQGEKLRVTVVIHGGEYVIKDGCKRAVAFYEGRKSLKSDSTVFPIWVITNR